MDHSPLDSQGSDYVSDIDTCIIPLHKFNAGHIPDLPKRIIGNILLDEPNAFLDFQNRNEVGRLLSDLAHKRGKCIIYSTHEPDLAKIYSDSILEISSEHLVRK